MSSLIVNLATVQTALQHVYSDYLKVWGPLIAVIGIAIGAIIWMFSSLTNNSGGAAFGIRVAGICVAAVVVLFLAVAIVNIGKTLGS